MKTEKGVDPGVYELAERFAPEGWEEHAINALAQHIQQAIELYLEGEEDGAQQ